MKSIIIILLIAMYFNFGACHSFAADEISFKGVPLGKANVKESLRKICKQSNRNTGDTCSFNENPTLMKFSYGILSDTFGYVTFDKDDSLLSVELYGSKSDLYSMVEVLTAKHGQPVKTKETVENKRGTKFDNELFVWGDMRGSRIKIETIYLDINNGRISIESSKAIALEKAAEKSLREAGKNNL